MTIEAEIETELGEKVTSIVTIKNNTIQIYKITTNKANTYLAKYQTEPNNNFINQAKELNLLRNYIHTPEVIYSSRQYQVLEWIEENNKKDYQRQLGQELAILHRQEAIYFGFEFNNTIGLMNQKNVNNEKITSWKDFFWLYRLLYQINYAYKSKKIDQSLYENLLLIEPKLTKYIDNSVKPSLLHGDLWSGNVINGKENPYFIDSACYYGHREMDFALIHMFGGFNDNFYNAYNNNYQLEEGFEQRKPLYMLYHYLNHLNIFGAGYNFGVINCANYILNDK